METIGHNPEQTDIPDFTLLEQQGKAELAAVLERANSEYEAQMARGNEKEPSTKKVLILDCSNRGNRPTLFITLSDPRLDSSNCESFLVAQGQLEQLPSNPENIAGVIFSGSAANIEDKSEAPWIETAEEYMKMLLKQGVPVLGICFGMQLHADAEGRDVPRNYGGVERGLWKSSLFLDSDKSKHPIFSGFDFQTDATGNASMLLNTIGFHNFRVGDHTGGNLSGYSYPGKMFDFDNFDPDDKTKEAYPMVEIDNNFIGVQFHPECDTELGVDYQIALHKSVASKIKAKGDDPVHYLEDLSSYKQQMPNEKNRSVRFIENFVNLSLG